MKQLLMKRKKAFTIYLIACLFPVISQLANTFVFSYLLGGIPNATYDYIKEAAIYGGGIILFSVGLYMISRFLRIRFMRDTLLDVRVQAFDKILSMPFQTFSKKSKEVYISNLINDINLFEKNFFLTLLNVIFLGATYVITMIILLFLDFKFGCAILLVSLSVYAITHQFQNKTVALQQEVSEKNEQFTVEVSNTLNGMEILKLNGLEDTFLNKTLKSVDRIEWKKLYYDVFAQGQKGFSMFLGSLVFVGILVYLLFQVRSGMTITRMTFMIQIANSCIWPLQNLVPLLNELKSSTKIYEKIAAPIEVEQMISGNEPFEFHGEIKIENLHYAYDENTIFKNISFTLEKGKKYLLKGASGSGKSTLMKVLSKTFHDYEGEILVDGISYRSLENLSFNKKVSFIYQDVFLFEDSLKNNVTLYGEENIERIQYAVQMAGLKEFIERHHEGIEQQILENGKNLSGGERQRISIARALYKSSDLLFADEATSSLNYELGKEVETSLLNLPCTVLAVSHRYYEGVSECFDYVLHLEDGVLKQYDASYYFSEEYVA